MLVESSCLILMVERSSLWVLGIDVNYCFLVSLCVEKVSASLDYPLVIDHHVFVLGFAFSEVATPTHILLFLRINVIFSPARPLKLCFEGVCALRAVLLGAQSCSVVNNRASQCTSSIPWCI